MKINQKIVNWEQASQLCGAWREKDERIVFTNGCFDILHKGHVQYLEQAAELGDRLIIGLNSDDSTMRLKGPDRPINSQDSRAHVMASIGYVDAVVVFDEDTPAELIHLLNPDILVKGGDYNPDDIVGADHVRALGGEVVVLSFLEGFSTSSIEKKIRGFE
ncbi:MAG: D-glycero-beta-D-manno-heptose 1-phosphate adenylyltransferase, partial [Bacteroidetes bacterium]